MKRALFGVTYAITTEESAADGEHAESGWIEEFVPLRDAVKAVRETRTNAVDGISSIECSESGAPRFVTVSNGMEFETGAYEERSLHMPRNLTPATRRRIARLVGARAP